MIVTKRDYWFIESKSTIGLWSRIYSSKKGFGPFNWSQASYSFIHLKQRSVHSLFLQYRFFSQIFFTFDSRRCSQGPLLSACPGVDLSQRQMFLAVYSDLQHSTNVPYMATCLILSYTLSRPTNQSLVITLSHIKQFLIQFRNTRHVYDFPIFVSHKNLKRCRSGCDKSACNLNPFNSWFRWLHNSMTLYQFSILRAKLIVPALNRSTSIQRNARLSDLKRELTRTRVLQQVVTSNELTDKQPVSTVRDQATVINYQSTTNRISFAFLLHPSLLLT